MARKKIQDMIEELRSWLPNYDHKDYPTTLFRFLASLPGGEELEDMGYEPMPGISWHEADQLGRVLEAIQDKSDVEDLVAGLIHEEEEVEERSVREMQAASGPSFKPSSIENAYDEAIAFLAGREHKKLGPNTTMHADLAHSGPVLVRFHENLIVTYEPGTIKLSSQGYKTYTTKERLNWFLPTGWSVAQEQNEWFVYGPNHRRMRFEDGMVLTSGMRETRSVREHLSTTVRSPRPLPRRR